MSTYATPVSDLAAREQSSFLVRVYAHLILAVLLLACPVCAYEAALVWWWVR
jgi:hypothetical protein